MISVLTLFVLIAASRLVNKNVSTDAEQNEVQSRAFINYRGTVKPVVTSLGLCTASQTETDGRTERTDRQSAGFYKVVYTGCG